MVALIIRDGTNTPRTITALPVRDGTNTPRTITELWIRDLDNVPRLVFNPSGSATLAVSLSTDTVFGRSHGSGTATTNSVTATVTGGTGPFTYAWVLLSTDGVPNATAGSPAAATTTFTQTGMAPDDFVTTNWRLTVTDANAVAVTADLLATFSDYSGLIDTR
jgi:hypothetical protein